MCPQRVMMLLDSEDCQLCGVSLNSMPVLSFHILSNAELQRKQPPKLKQRVQSKMLRTVLTGPRHFNLPSKQQLSGKLPIPRQSPLSTKTTNRKPSKLQSRELLPQNTPLALMLIWRPASMPSTTDSSQECITVVSSDSVHLSTLAAF